MIKTQEMYAKYCKELGLTTGVYDNTLRFMNDEVYYSSDLDEIFIDSENRIEFAFTDVDGVDYYYHNDYSLPVWATKDDYVDVPLYRLLEDK